MNSLDELTRTAALSQDDVAITRKKPKPTWTDFQKTVFYLIKSVDFLSVFPPISKEENSRAKNLAKQLHDLATK